MRRALNFLVCAVLTCTVGSSSTSPGELMYDHSSHQSVQRFILYRPPQLRGRELNESGGIRRCIRLLPAGAEARRWLPARLALPRPRRIGLGGATVSPLPLP